jgi:O-antigen/teichoic acid export membrane protein
MLSLQRLKQSRAARNTAASYLAFVAISLCGLVSVPIAVTYLSKSEMGMWSIVFTVVGYLLWLDFGIGNATGRKIAEAMEKGDRTEINRWWTLSIGVLCLLGLLMLAVALAISPFLAGWLKIPTEQRGDALWLFLGTATVSAIGMPVRAYPGLLVAQERFHWVPLVQGFTPWLQLLIFWKLLHSGFGVRSYFPSLMLSQAVGWVILVWLVHGKCLRVQLDFGGWTRARFHDLFTYSGSLAVGGVVSSIIYSLPAMLLARLGGLPLVPVYNLSNRCPGMINSLAQRTTQSFYPNLQKLYVLGEYVRFQQKYSHVNQLGIWVGLIGVGAILGCNRTVICWLATEDFYAGHWTNLAFACATLTTAFVSSLVNLQQFAGLMGKSALFSALELPVAALLCWAGFRFAGLPGLAWACVIIPMLLRGPYALYAGSRSCGFRIWELCGDAILSLALVLLATVGAGLWMPAYGSDLEQQWRYRWRFSDA